MKKVLFVIESLNCGGAEKSLVTLLNNLDFSKLSIELLLIKKGGDFEKFVPLEVKVIYHDPIESLDYFQKMVNRYKFFLLRLFVRKYHLAQLFWKAYGKNILGITKEYDIAIAYNQGFSTYFVAEKILANKKIAWLNIDYQKAGYLPKFDISMYKKFEKIVTVSEECQLSLINSMNTIGEEISTLVIEDILDIDMIRNWSLRKIDFPLTEGSIQIVTAARLAKQKGLHLAIDACKFLKDKGIPVKWYIIGEGPERNVLEERIKQADLQDDFYLIGFKENPYPAIKKCDIYVQTSLFEGMGLTVIEAAILEKPIVCTNFPTSYLIIRHEINGLICDMNAESVVQSILRYINNPDFTKNVINNLKDFVKSNKKESLKRFYSTIAC